MDSAQAGLLRWGAGWGLTVSPTPVFTMCRAPGEDEAASGRERLCSGVCRDGLGSCWVYQDGWEWPL